jgi:hypothetical protein
MWSPIWVQIMWGSDEEFWIVRNALVRNLFLVTKNSGGAIYNQALQYCGRVPCWIRTFESIILNDIVRNQLSMLLSILNQNVEPAIHQNFEWQRSQQAEHVAFNIESERWAPNLFVTVIRLRLLCWIDINLHKIMQHNELILGKQRDGGVWEKWSPGGVENEGKEAARRRGLRKWLPGAEEDEEEEEEGGAGKEKDRRKRGGGV